MAESGGLFWMDDGLFDLTEPWRYGLLEEGEEEAGGGERVTPLISDAGAKVLPKCEPGPSAAAGSGAVMGSRRAAAACD